ncbi:DUF2850 domain-containing protein [Vibrio sp. MarTm2]|uniref:DUF2850 domain-containing protein n=1 Tax=Vibrio sp. MarTm2 TaxID=2998831 RepID=UPI0022CD2239|nr:DUF2850 domain-containing protein [Vibrio sp. MarTm2]MDA0129193.1 DUF2850 domain-containing protein [Vibrio sp. MarTm2]
MIQAKIIKLLFVAIFLSLAAGFSSLLYFSYNDYIHPKHVYGTWIEVGAPSYSTETLTLNEQGVFRNNRLIATSFEFDGEQVFIETGSGTTIYQIAGTFNSPQLRRLQPSIPIQRFVKAGYEDTVDMEGGGGASKRRAALSEHFSNK